MILLSIESNGNPPEVTVVLPYCNRQDSLQDAIESVLAQTFSSLRLVLVDDGSTDGSRKVAASFKDERVVHVWCDTNQGVCVARNLGIDRASDSRLIAFMDSDDVWLPEKLATQVAEFSVVQRCDPRVAVMGCGWRLAGAQIGRKRFGRGPYDWCDVLMGRVAGIGTPMLLVDRELVGPGPRFDPELPALVDRDYVLSCLGLELHVAVVPEELALVNRGRNDHVANSENACRAWEKYLQKYSEQLDQVPGGRSLYHFRAAREWFINRSVRKGLSHVRSALEEQPLKRMMHLGAGIAFGARGFGLASRLVGDASWKMPPGRIPPRG